MTAAQPLLPNDAPTEERNEVRDRIIVEATRLFAEQGFARTSVREITDAAGVTKPTLYYWFGSKDGLFTALVEHHLNAWLHGTAEILRSEGAVIERITRYVEHTFENYAQREQALRFLMVAITQAGQGAPEVDTMRYHAAQVHMLVELLKEGVTSGELRAHDPVASVYLLMGAVQMRIGGAMHAGHALEPDSASKILELFFHGVR